MEQSKFFKRQLQLTLLIGVCFLFLGIGVFLSLIDKNRELEDYTFDHARTAKLLEELHQQIGYGGLIHNFKNYLLRGQEIYYSEALQNTVQINDKVDLLGRLLPDIALNDLLTIETTVAKYRHNLELIKEHRLKGLSINAIDKLVIIDDTAARKSFSKLHFINAEKLKEKRLQIQTNRKKLYVLIALFVISLLLVFGMLRQLRAIHQDLSQLLDTQAASTQKNNELISGMPDGFICINESGIIVDANDKAEIITGYNTAELLHRKVESLVPDALVTGHIRQRETYSQNPTSRFMGSRTGLELKQKSGKLVPVEVMLHPAGEKQIYVYIRDITDLQKLSKEAMEQQRRFEILSDALEVVFWMSTPGVKEMLFVSHGYEKIWERSTESLYKNPRSFTDLVHPEDKPRVLAELMRHAQGHWDITYRIVLESGEVKWISDKGFPLFNETGMLIGLTGVASDITPIKQAEISLKKINETLEERVELRTKELTRSNAELEQFAYIASHDLQEPLRKISSFGSRLEKMLTDKLNDKEQQYFSIIISASRRMKILIDDLLTYSRTTSKDIAYQHIDMNKLIETVLDDQQLAIKDANAELQVDSFPDMIADESLMQLLLHNLIANALKFRDEKRPCKIAIHYKGIGRRHIIEIKDNGIGIPEQQRNKIFQIFERLHGRSTYEGTGIGLAICHRIVDRHQGTIKSKSNEWGGSTFEATIDAGLEAEDDEAL
ncbi:MAG: ATP-binding protein [Pseudomonadales bacterium]|nr:ATP-binding protein [Pseudomonadales bacterium]